MEPTYLSKLYGHCRDGGISLDEATHVYTVNGETNYQSVTTFCHSHFPHFDGSKIVEKIIKSQRYMTDPTYKYYRIPKEEILRMWDNAGKDASAKGTEMHFQIECYLNNMEVECRSIEFQFFLEFDEAFKRILKPYRTEWRIYHEELRLSGSVDMVYYHIPDQTFHIYDWKRTKPIEKENAFGECAVTESISHIPNTSYWHYALQLNVYRYILQEKYGMKIAALYLVRLHPESVTKTYDRIELPLLDEVIKTLVQERLALK